MPIESFNTKWWDAKDININSDRLYFMLPNSRKIELVTSDQAVAKFLGISCTKLGYTSDIELQEEREVHQQEEMYEVKVY